MNTKCTPESGSGKVVQVWAGKQPLHASFQLFSFPDMSDCFLEQIRGCYISTLASCRHLGAINHLQLKKHQRLRTNWELGGSEARLFTHHLKVKRRCDFYPHGCGLFWDGWLHPHIHQHANDTETVLTALTHYLISFAEFSFHLSQIRYFNSMLNDIYDKINQNKNIEI